MPPVPVGVAENTKNAVWIKNNESVFFRSEKDWKNFTRKLLWRYLTSYRTAREQ